jgi:pyruvate formate lyase activating enzyme
MREGQRGMCFVRAVEGGAVVLTTYGRSSGFCVDPIEKKPLNHFLPGTPVLSFGTAGCNLACRFCQNWDISKSKEIDTLADAASPETIARVAEQLGCRSVAFTYNDPVIFLEYAIDVADACRERGLHPVAVTAGYICDEPRVEFYRHMDAANVDLKAFTEDFYKHVTVGHLQPVLDTLEYLRHETEVWFEITNLVIPGHNDSDGEFDEMSAWIGEHLGPDVPLHFTAFHPDFKMLDVPPPRRRRSAGHARSPCATVCGTSTRATCTTPTARARTARDAPVWSSSATGTCSAPTTSARPAGARSVAPRSPGTSTRRLAPGALGASRSGSTPGCRR